MVTRSHIGHSSVENDVYVEREESQNNFKLDNVDYLSRSY